MNDPLHVWLPYITTTGGADVSTRRLAQGLRHAGHVALSHPLPHAFEHFPWPLRLLEPPDSTQVILGANGNALAFRRPGTALVMRIALYVLDPEVHLPRLSTKGIYYRTLDRHFHKAGFRAADATVAQSHYTARTFSEGLGVAPPRVIHNGIDLSLHTPAERDQPWRGDRPFRLLFVGNLRRRKGADLLGPLMDALGPGFELEYTSGWRPEVAIATRPNLTDLGLLSRERVVDAYRRADLFIYPTRLESFANPVVEAMACGTPALTTDGLCMPEIIDDGVDGLMRPVDVDAFSRAIRDIRDDPDKLAEMGRKARQKAVERFGFQRMVRDYVALFRTLV